MPLTQGATLSAPPNGTGTTTPLTRLLGDWALLLLMVFMIQGCGLVVDAGAVGVAHRDQCAGAWTDQPHLLEPIL